MIKYLFASVMILHGLFHFIGFAKALSTTYVPSIHKNVSATAGAFWFVSAVLLLAVVVLFLLQNEYWPMVAIVAVILSQVLIITLWKDARYGTIANIILLLVALYGRI